MRGLSFHIASGSGADDNADTPHMLLPPRRERPGRRRPAEQRDELTPSYVDHRLPLGTRCASLWLTWVTLEAPQVVPESTRPPDS
jgi:hypothetical protein